MRLYYETPKQRSAHDVLEKALQIKAMKSKSCSVCGSQFTCGPETENTGCWCADFPPIMPLDFSKNCRCPSCLKKVVKKKIDEYVQTITPENAFANVARNYAADSQLIEDIDFYLNDDGNCVFTAWYHLKRGTCCQNGCLHCPYGY